jgi:hypothetical protein
MTGHDRTSDDHWLTYIEAAELLGISSEAVRAIARRQKWPRQSANAVGRAVRILIPADRLRPVATNGQAYSGQWARPVTANGRSNGEPQSQPDLTGHGQRAQPDTTGQGQRADDLLSAVREMTEMFMGPAREQIADLKMQLTTERERANRAEGQVRETEDRVRELQEKLEAEMIEHRRMVSLLTERLMARRSWWPWRRRT